MLKVIASSTVKFDTVVRSSVTNVISSVFSFFIYIIRFVYTYKLYSNTRFYNDYTYEYILHFVTKRIFEVSV